MEFLSFLKSLVCIALFILLFGVAWVDFVFFLSVVHFTHLDLAIFIRSFSCLEPPLVALDFAHVELSLPLDDLFFGERGGLSGFFVSGKSYLFLVRGGNKHKFRM